MAAAPAVRKKLVTTIPTLNQKARVHRIMASGLSNAVLSTSAHRRIFAMPV
jgi:hypothetical protein